MASAASAVSKALPRALKEVRFHLCQSGQASAGARQYIESSYKSFKQANPEVPFLIREASGTPARIFARFERGFEKSAVLDGLSASDVGKKVSEVIGRAE